MLLIIPAVLLICLIFLVTWLVVISPGKPEPFIDEHGRTQAGSISEKIHVTINGLEQGMFIQGKDRTKPVLLFVHGGPGMPEYTVSRKYPIVLEDHFIVCWWEQRGSGLSYSPGIPVETLTVEQLISDTIEVSRYLRKRFGREKIYLFSHSWGSFIGIQAAARAPELYAAYIGMGQVSRQLESEKLAYRYMLERYTQAGDDKMVQRLKKYPMPELDAMPLAYRPLRDEAMHQLGIGTTHAMKSVVSGIFLPVMQSRAYTLSEKINVWRGKWSAHSTHLLIQLNAADLTVQVPGLEIPVYIFQGIYDYTASYSLARDHFQKLHAPMKGFYTFGQSAHSPLFEEPEKMHQLLHADVLGGVNKFADAETVDNIKVEIRDQVGVEPTLEPKGL